MKKFTLFLMTMALFVVGTVSSFALKVKPTFSPVATDGQTVQYIYNVETQTFILGANDWETRASVSLEKGYQFKVAANGDGTYTLNDYCHTNGAQDWAWRAMFADNGASIWVDNASGANVNKWVITALGSNTYEITNPGANGTNKLGVQLTLQDTRLYLDTNPANGMTWAFVNADDYEAYLQAAADEIEAEKQAKIDASNKAALAAQKALMDGTNVYDAAGFAAYAAKYNELLAAVNKGGYKETVVNPNVATGWHASTDYNFLLNPWTIGGKPCNNFDTPLYINTWSTEGNNDGSKFYVPFFEYWVGDADALAPNTLQAKIEGLQPNKNYKATVWVRVRVRNGNSDPAHGITFQAGDGFAVNACGTKPAGTPQMYLANIEAEGNADAEGVLTLTFQIEEGNNISWLSFKNVNYAYNEVEAAVIDLGTPDYLISMTSVKEMYDIVGPDLKTLKESGLHIEFANHPELLTEDYTLSYSIKVNNGEVEETVPAFNIPANERFIDLSEDLFEDDKEYTITIPANSVIIKDKSTDEIVALNKKDWVYKFYTNDFATPKKAEFAENKAYYLVNIEDGGFLNAGASWGTRAILSEAVGHPFYFKKVNDGVYTISLDNSTQHTLGTDLYVDNGAQYGWTIYKYGSSYVITDTEIENTTGIEAGDDDILVNGDFQTGAAIDNHVCGYGKDMESNGTTYYSAQPVSAWTIADGLGTVDDKGFDHSGLAGAVFAYGSAQQLKGGNFAAPAVGPDGNPGQALGMVAVWGQSIQYTQNVNLPAGTFTLTFDVYNQNGTSAVDNLFGFIAADGKTYYGNATTFAVGAWTKVQVDFTLPKATEGKISLGYKSRGSGSGANPHLFIDNVVLKCNTVQSKLGLGYLGAKNDTGLLESGIESYKNEGAQWRILSKEELLQSIRVLNMEEDLTADLTTFIENSGFGRADNTASAWKNEGATIGTSGEVSATNANFVAEAYKKSFSISQTIEIPNGTYEVGVNGYARHDAAANGNAQLFANTVATTLMDYTVEAEAAGNPNNMQEAAVAFANGYYKNTLKVKVTDGTLTLGVRYDGNSDWVCFDNFTLECLGIEDETLLGIASIGAIATNNIVEKAGKLTDECYEAISYEGVGLSFPNVELNEGSVIAVEGTIVCDGVPASFHSAFEAPKGSHIIYPFEKGHTYQIIIPIGGARLALHSCAVDTPHRPTSHCDNIVLATNQQVYAFEFTTPDAPTSIDDLKNLNFDEGTMIDNGVCTYDYDCEKNNTTYSMMQPVKGWTLGVENGNTRAAALYAWGSPAFLGGAGYVIPETDALGNTEGGALGIIGVWTGTVQYVQEVEMPAGDYDITFHVYNAGGTGEIVENLCGFIAGGKKYCATEKTFPVGEWTTLHATFTLEETTAGKLSVGYVAANAGSGSMPHLFIDKVSMTGETVGMAGNNTGADATVIAGIESLNGEVPVAYYSASGALLAAPVKGINIVKMADNTVKKIYVK